MRTVLILLTAAIAQSAPAVNELPSPFEVAKNDPSLSALKAIYDVTEMKFKIDQSRDITVFMPNNKALESYSLTKMSYPEIVRILNYHNLGRVVKLEELAPGDHNLETIEGGFLTVTIDPQRTITINHEAHVVKPAIETPMGIAYIIDQVLMPPALDDVSTELANLSTEIVEFSDSIVAPDHIRAVNDEQRKRNDVSGLVAATAEKILESEDKDEPAGEVGVISGTKRRASKVGNESVRKSKEFKPARTRSMVENTVRVGNGRSGNHHSGGPDIAFRERGKLY